MKKSILLSSLIMALLCIISFTFSSENASAKTSYGPWVHQSKSYKGIQDGTAVLKASHAKATVATTVAVNTTQKFSSAISVGVSVPIKIVEASLGLDFSKQKTVSIKASYKLKKGQSIKIYAVPQYAVTTHKYVRNVFTNKKCTQESRTVTVKVLQNTPKIMTK